MCRWGQVWAWGGYHNSYDSFYYICFVYFFQGQRSFSNGFSFFIARRGVCSSRLSGKCYTYDIRYVCCFQQGGVGVGNIFNSYSSCNYFLCYFELGYGVYGCGGYSYQSYRGLIGNFQEGDHYQESFQNGGNVYCTGYSLQYYRKHFLGQNESEFNNCRDLIHGRQRPYWPKLRGCIQGVCERGCDLLRRQPYGHIGEHSQLY